LRSVPAVMALAMVIVLLLSHDRSLERAAQPAE
jgi:hypothetical protein